MPKSKPIRILCVGVGHMGRSHALAYHQPDGFEICGIVTRSAASRDALNNELGGDIDGFSDFHEALCETKQDAVSISTYPDAHVEYALAAFEAGCHVFIEKPLAESVAEAEKIVEATVRSDRKLAIGYILRHHPGWRRFIEISHTLGKPLVMRMNLNQQSSGADWATHKNLMSSVSPLADCGVYYVDVMCRMTCSKPIRVSRIGARLTDELQEGKINYGALQVSFEEGSVGWCEAGLGPMMSEGSFFIKDVVAPKAAYPSSRTMRQPWVGAPTSMPTPRTSRSGFIVPGFRLTERSRKPMKSSASMTSRTMTPCANANRNFSSKPYSKTSISPIPCRTRTRRCELLRRRMKASPLARPLISDTNL